MNRVKLEYSFWSITILIPSEVVDSMTNKFFAVKNIDKNGYLKLAVDTLQIYICRNADTYTQRARARAHQKIHNI